MKTLLGVVFTVISSLFLHAATINKVYKGTATIAAGTSTGTVTLPTTVDLTKSFVTFNYTVDNANPNRMFIGGRFSSTSQLTFSRVTNGGGQVDITWTVHEFSAGVSVQHGMLSMSGNTIVNQSISAITTANTFPIFSFNKDGGTYGNDDGITVEFTSTTNVRFRRSGNTGDQHDVYYQIVTWDNATVQTVSPTLSNGNDSTGATLGTPVTPENTMIFNTQRISGNVDMDDLPIFGLSGTDEIYYKRVDDESTFNFITYVVETPDITTFARTACFESGISNRLNFPLGCTIDTANAAILPVGPMGGGALGCIDDDNVGSSWFTTEFSGTNTAALRRKVADDPSSIGLQITVYGSAPGCTNGGDVCPIADLCNDDFIVPVRYGTIQAEYVGNVLTIAWNTLFQRNTNYFVVEASVDGKNFDELSVVNTSASNSNMLMEYAFETATSQRYEYVRISEVDLNGGVTFSEIISISGVKEDGDYKLFPTMISGGMETTIAFENINFTLLHFVVTDELGRVSVDKEFFVRENKVTLPMGTFPSGVYFISFTFNEELITEKVLVFN